MKLWLVLLSIYYEFLYKKFFQKKFSDQVYSYVILSIWNIYQTFPVIPTIGTFVATELLGRVSSKNKQHLAAHNISLRFWSIFVTSLLLEVISSFLYVLLHYSYWTFNLLKNKKTKQNKKNYSPGLFTVMYLISNFSKRVFFFLRKN